MKLQKQIKCKTEIGKFAKRILSRKPDYEGMILSEGVIKLWVYEWYVLKEDMSEDFYDRYKECSYCVMKDGRKMKLHGHVKDMLTIELYIEKNKK